MTSEPITLLFDFVTHFLVPFFPKALFLLMRACVVLVVVLFTAVCTNASSPLQPDAPTHQEHSTAIQPVSLYLIDECNHLDHLSDDSDEADLSVERKALGQPDEPRVACAKASSLFDALKDAGKGFLKRAFSFEQQKKERVSLVSFCRRRAVLSRTRFCLDCRASFYGE